jgi:hypothetical protein
VREGGQIRNEVSVGTTWLNHRWGCIKAYLLYISRMREGGKVRE